MLRADWVDQQPDNYDLAARVEKVAAALAATNASTPPGTIMRDREVWQRIAKLAPGFKFEQILDRPTHERLRKRLQAAGQPFRLRYFLTVTSPAGVKPRELAQLLKQLSFVGNAYEEPQRVAPSIGGCPSTVLTPPQDQYFSEQGYLTAAPVGIDALFLREHWPGGTTSHPGMGVHIADVEQGWHFAHEDLPTGIPLHGENVISSRYHGAAVLGIIVAQPNTLGCLGIAPGTQMIAVSHEGRTNAAAMAVAIDQLSAGDILLLETTIKPLVRYNPGPSTGGQEDRDDIPLPVESSDDERAAVRDAISLDITVIESAGNGSIDLDTVFDLSNNRLFSPATDSGAIIVAGAESTVPHVKRRPGSNIGSSVSCYAWGYNVRTCSFKESDPTWKYTPNFGVSSAAAAIVAGAAAAVQSFAVLKTGASLKPAALRQLLITGGTTSPDKIGVMPNLRTVVTSLCDGSYRPSAPAAPRNLRII
jgi:serine protease